MQKKYAYYLVVPGVLFLTFFMAIPILTIIFSTIFVDGKLTLEGYIQFLTDPYYLKIIYRTLKISILTTLICMILAYPSAYFISKLKAKKKFIFIALAVFPLLTSPVVRSFSWMAILGRNGVVNDTLLKLGIINEPLQILYTEFAIFVGLVHLFLPLMIIALVGVMENIDGDLVRAANNLGASKLGAFFKVVIPLSIPGLLIGSVLVFVGSLTSYTTPLLLGGNQRVLATLLQQQALTLNNWHMASIIATIMIVATFIIIGTMNAVANKLNPKG